MLRFKKSNCFIWGILSFLKYGGKIKISKSDFGPIPRMHWLNPNDNKWYHYHPKRPLRYNDLPLLRKIFMVHVLWFEGNAKQSKQ